MKFKHLTENYEISDTGIIRNSKTQKILKPYLQDGYVRIASNGKFPSKLVHRLVYMIFVGDIPDGLEINHKNGVRNDNRLENLETVSRRENQSHRHRNKKKYTGVKWNFYHQMYEARIGINGKKLSLGYFTTPEEASIAYQNKLQECNWNNKYSKSADRLQTDKKLVQFSSSANFSNF